MRFLTWVVILAVAGWSAFWFIGSSGIETGLQAWFEERRNDGWAADAADISTHGFPNRFDSTIADIRLADPKSGVAWTMPFFQILALSYKPNHIIAVFPDTQSLSSPSERVDITNKKLQGSVLLVPDTALELDRSTFELDQMSITSSTGWTLEINSGQLSTRRTEVPNNYDIFFDAKGLQPNKWFMRELDPNGVLSDTFDRLEFDASAAFDAPWDRFAIEKARPQFQEIEIRSFAAGWGELIIQLAGNLSIDSNGWPNGTLDVRAKNWKEMLQVAGRTGVVPRQFIPTIEGALGAVARVSGNPNTLDAPLVFRNGTIFLAGFPVAQSPNLKLR